MKAFFKIFVLVAMITGLTAGAGLCEMTPEELAAESEAYCQSTANKTPTPPDAIIAKVGQACGLLQAEGTAAYPKFKGKGSAFLFEGTYIWIHALKDGTMLMHPIKYKMEGKNMIGLKDTKGKRFFVTMNNLVNDKGQGWVEYYWPVPGTNNIVRKVSFVKKCTLPDGTDVVLGCGIYNGDEAAMAKLKIY